MPGNVSTSTWGDHGIEGFRIQCNSSARSVVLITDQGLAFTVFTLSGEGSEAKFEVANQLPNAARARCDEMAAEATQSLRAALKG